MYRDNDLDEAIFEFLLDDNEKTPVSKFTLEPVLELIPPQKDDLKGFIYNDRECACYICGRNKGSFTSKKSYVPICRDCIDFHVE